MSRVIVVKYITDKKRCPLSQDKYKLLLSTGLKTLAGNNQLSAAVKTFLPRGVVGFKTNCLVRKLNSTPVALAAAFGDLLVESGFNDNDIVVWERTNRELEQAGYKLNASSFGRRCLGTDTNGLGYSDSFYSSGQANSLVSRILTDLVDHNVNLPVLKDHSIAGLSGCLKNMFGAINNPNKYHDFNCDPFAADISSLAPIKTKNRLGVIDAVRIQYHGGPGYAGSYLADYGGLIISADPVAADRVGLELVEHFRAKNGLPPLADTGRPVKYLDSAAERGLGVADLNNIDLKVIDIDTDGTATDGKLLP